MSLPNQRDGRSLGQLRAISVARGAPVPGRLSFSLRMLPWWPPSGDGARIVRAHANRESPKPAARPFPVGSCSLSRCCHVCPSVANMVHGNHLQCLNGVRGRSLDELSGKHASSTRALAARIGIDLGRWWSMPLAKY